MPWTYEIVTGTLYDPSGNAVGAGYSGAPGHKNDATAQSLHDLGPIPVGCYVVEEPKDTETHGPYVLPLDPDPGNQMFGRAGFLIHGDSVAHPGTASKGCIILSRATRELVGQSADNLLDVVENFTMEA